MKPFSRLSTIGRQSCTSQYISRYQCLHTSVSKPAKVLPVTAHGPPPGTPLPGGTASEDRIAPGFGFESREQHDPLEAIQAIKQETESYERAQAMRKRVQEMRQRVQGVQEIHDQITGIKRRNSKMTKRFWKDVYVRQEEETFKIYLDDRPLRTPSKSILTIPFSKPHLASAIALEWDLLTSPKQALRQHLIPLTSLVSRALDIETQDSSSSSRTTFSKPRQEIITMAMRYLDTDTLLCWAPEQSSHDLAQLEQSGIRTESLRDIQRRTAMPIMSYLRSQFTPKIEILPVLGTDSIIPTPQPEATRDALEGWISRLPAWELVGLERGILASKSLLVAMRLVMEWSEVFSAKYRSEERRFGIEEAAEAASVEVRWQTGMWGEVEDSHDVEKEDLRRQLGSVILLISGETAR